MAAAKKPLFTTADAPTTVQIEPTRGCNLRCGMCAVPVLQKGPGDYQFMTPATARGVGAALAAAAAAHGWNPRLELACGGEPTLNPDIVEIVATLRGCLPQASIMLLSNGSGFLKREAKLMERLLAVGINTVAIDHYEEVNIVPRLLSGALALPAGVPLHHYPVDKAANPHSRYFKQRVVVIQDIKAATKGTHSKLNNHAAIGSAPVMDAPGAAPLCVKPFREVQIHWDGVMGVCCHNFSRELDVGSVVTAGAYPLWQSELMMAIRRKLMARERDFRPCAGCDFSGNRVGLLPDRMGKQRMGAVKPTDAALIAEHTRKPPTTALKRVQWLPGLVTAKRKSLTKD
jgi:hypothetical protein